VDGLSLVRDHTVLSVLVGSRAYVDGPDAERFSRELERLLGLALEADLTRHGEPLVDVADHRDRLLAVRRGVR
jgi:hypothetical protein